MSLIGDAFRYQPEFNSVLARLYKLLESLDERINILIDEST